MFIGDLARRTGLTVKAIRYYETIGILPPSDRTPAGYRVYTAQDEERLRFVKAAKAVGLRLGDIREVLAFRDRGEAPCTFVRERIREEAAGLDRRIDELRRLRDQLEALDRLADMLPPEAYGDGCICHLIQQRHARAR
ncbi:MAG: MerR family transcriptional regulator [Firmicutes bacterium]|nr:MerR family transcriptional regulator [Bacillota bacterium]